MNKHEFDIWVKDRLEGLEVPLDEASWVEFEQQLSEAEIQQFDQQIREKLDAFSAPTAAGTWAAFEHKLDSAEHLNNENLDQAVREKLENVSASNDPDAWYRFLPVLQNFEIYRRRLIITKVSEFLLIFAILFTIFNLHQHGVLDSPFSKERKERIENNNAKIPIAAVINDNDDVYYKENNSVALAETGNKKGADNSGSTSIAFAQQEKITSINEATISLTSNQIIFFESNTNSSNLAYPESAINDDIISELANNIQLEVGSDIVSSPPEISHINFNIPEIGLKRGFLRKQKKNDLGIPIPKKHKKIELLAGIGIGGNFDQINTPFDEYYNIEPYQQIRGSAATDISFRAKRKRLGLRTGISFSHKQYNPQPVYELYGGDFLTNFKGTSLKKIEFDILSSALHCSYDIVAKPRFSIYALAGASLNILANSSYDRQEYEVPVVKGDPMPSDRGHTGNITIADAKSYVKGILQGGTFADNRFMTVDAGLGIEWKVTERSRLFLNPVYKHMLSTTGIGPNQDNINSLSFRAGIETLL